MGKTVFIAAAIADVGIFTHASLDKKDNLDANFTAGAFLSKYFLNSNRAASSAILDAVSKLSPWKELPQQTSIPKLHDKSEQGTS